MTLTAFSYDGAAVERVRCIAYYGEGLLRNMQLSCDEMKY